MANIDSKYDSFIYFTIKFNLKDYSISFFQEYSIKKKFNNIFPHSIQKLIQKVEFGFIQFNKIFIQLENQGIEHHQDEVTPKQHFGSTVKVLDKEHKFKTVR